MDAFVYTDGWGDLKATCKREKRGVWGRISSVEKTGKGSGKEAGHLPKGLSAGEGRRRQHGGLAELTRSLFVKKALQGELVSLFASKNCSLVIACAWSHEVEAAPETVFNHGFVTAGPGWQRDPCRSGAGGLSVPRLPAVPVVTQPLGSVTNPVDKEPLRRQLSVPTERMCRCVVSNLDSRE